MGMYRRLLPFVGNFSELNNMPEKTEISDAKTVALEILKYLIKGEYVEFFDKRSNGELKKNDKTLT